MKNKTIIIKNPLEDSKIIWKTSDGLSFEDKNKANKHETKLFLKRIKLKIQTL